jgi:dipeptidyl aminopeptidase/acylaminoacyl peptidase
MPIAAYGTWPSPLTSAVLARGHVRYGFTTLVGTRLYWSELRSADQGRNVVVELGSDGTSRDVLPAPCSARTRVHEYGGKSYLVADNKLWFVNQNDQQIYVCELRDPAGTLRRLTSSAELRFAELTLDAKRARLLAIAEQHEPGSNAHASVQNCIVAVALQDGAVHKLATGRDFYAGIALAPDASQLAYLAWNHPHMPWDAAELHLAQLQADGSLHADKYIAGNAEASALQPTWSPTGQLYYTVEVDGAWRLARIEHGKQQVLAASGGELGTPLWQLGTRLWDFVDEHTIVGVSVRDGVSQLLTLDVREGDNAEWELLSSAYPFIGQLSAAAGQCVFSVGWAGSGSELVRIDLAHGACGRVRSAHADLLEHVDTATAEAIDFPTSHGEVAHGFFYAPKNQLYTGPAGTLPPLIVLVHGGPTAGAAASWNASVQYFTTRGFAVLDVNYRGSSGYGRVYRDRLRGEWGVLDVDDCVAGAEYLARAGHARVDRERMFIRGGSAGGYTVLQALANHKVFAAGSCHYGISDIEALTRDTHKFESHYDRFLIGPYPERRDLFVARSPIHYVQRIKQPVIFFQGLDDRVVPADQTERMAETLLQHGIQAEYHAYAGEAHGFRKAETIEHVLETELLFFQRIMSRV